MASKYCCSKKTTTLKLEVERKFRALACQPPLLVANSGNPPFQSLKFLGTRTFRDVYYDNNDDNKSGAILSNAGVWVRQRSGKWQAKIKRGGTYRDSRFEEIESAEEIADCVRRCLSTTLGSKMPQLQIHESNNFGLSPIASLTTVRQGWKADDAFQIVLDSTDFGHVVGEVELEREVEVEIEEEKRQQKLHSITTDMDQQIAEFMTKYSWAFQPGIPKGKLSAYFEWQKQKDKNKNMLHVG